MVTQIPTLYTVEEVAKLLHLNKETVLRFIREKKIKGIKVGRKCLVKESDLNVYIDSK